MNGTEFPSLQVDWPCDLSAEAARRLASPAAILAAGCYREGAPGKRRFNSSGQVPRMLERLSTTTTGTILDRPSDSPGRFRGSEERKPQCAVGIKLRSRVEAASTRSKSRSHFHRAGSTTAAIPETAQIHIWI